MRLRRRVGRENEETDLDEEEGRWKKETIIRRNTVTFEQEM